MRGGLNWRVGDLTARSDCLIGKNEDRTMPTVGKKVVYPSQGPCVIGGIVKRVVNDRPVMFYELFVLDNDTGAVGKGNLFIPVDKIEKVGIRPLLKRSDIPDLLGQLKEPARSFDNRRQRARDNLKLIVSGSAFDLAEIVESLTELRETKALSFSEQKTLERAKRLLVSEISEVTGETREEASDQVERALSARIKDPSMKRNVRDNGYR
jgi:CarD family transcriptional regulator